MAASPIFTGTVKVAGASIATTATYNPTIAVGQFTSLFTAGANGSRVTQIRFAAQGDTAASGIAVSIKDGSTYLVVHWVTVPAWVAGGDGPPWSATVTFPEGLFVEAGQELGITSFVPSVSVYATAMYGDY